MWSNLAGSLGLVQEAGQIKCLPPAHPTFGELIPQNARPSACWMESFPPLQRSLSFLCNAGLGLAGGDLPQEFTCFGPGRVLQGLDSAQQGKGRMTDIVDERLQPSLQF